MYLSSQLFFKTAHETLQFQEKSKKNTFSSDLQPKVQKYFPSVSNMGPTNAATELRKQSRN